MANLCAHIWNVWGIFALFLNFTLLLFIPQMLKTSSDRRTVYSYESVTVLWLVMLFWGFSACNVVLPCFSQVWAVPFSLSLFLHLRLHLSDHLLHPPQLRDTQTESHTDLQANIRIISLQLVFALRDPTSASFSCKIISLSISSGSGPFLHDTKQV